VHARWPLARQPRKVGGLATGQIAQRRALTVRKSRLGDDLLKPSEAAFGPIGAGVVIGLAHVALIVAQRS